MRLVEILRVLDDFTKVVIYTDECPDDEPAFEGIVCNIPWNLAECKINYGLDEGACGLSVRNCSSGATLVVSVTEREKE